MSVEGELLMPARRSSRYKEVPGQFGKAIVADEPVEEVKEEVKPEKPRKGVVIPELLNVRSAPVKTGKNEPTNVLAKVPGGSRVTINKIAAPNGWYNVTVEVFKGVKVTGYVMSEFIKEV
jgi:uncharacterized protein YgiM (DUF1202 family)